MNNEGLIGDLLRAHSLKRTPIRIEILGFFMDNDFALSASDILARMTSGHDRVTIYRALNSFEEHGILHRASEDAQGTKYALCSRQCPDVQHTDKHAHFICEECQQTYCLEEVKVPKVEVSNNFSIHKVNYTLSGICKTCNN